MVKLNCIIVEDEPVSQDLLKRYIEDCGQLVVVATCNNALEAFPIIANNRVDLMFLDINMPKLSGLDFYKSLSNPPDVIFTTAYPEYAIEGFEVDAIDYLVKPFSFERFMKAVARVRTVREPVDTGYIMLPADKRIHRIAIDGIIYAEAMRDYTRIFLKDGALIVHMTLQRLLEQLPQRRFARIHRSYIVALDKIEFVEGNFVSIQKLQLPIGDTYRGDFLDRLQRGSR